MKDKDKEIELTFQEDIKKLKMITIGSKVGFLNTTKYDNCIYIVKDIYQNDVELRNKMGSFKLNEFWLFEK